MLLQARHPLAHSCRARVRPIGHQPAVNLAAAVQDAFGVEMLRVEACLGQAWLKRQRVLRDPGLIDDPRPPPKRREPSA